MSVGPRGVRDTLLLIALFTLTAGALPTPVGATVPERVRCSPTTTPCDVPADLAAKIDEFSGEIGRRLGRVLPSAPAVAFDTGRGPDDAFATAEPADAAGRALEPSRGPSAGCLVTIFERSLPRSELDNTIAHEVFHCFQFALDGARLPEWFSEGSAEWVGTTLGGSDRTTRGRWQAWMREPGTSLFDREHEAMGFFAVLDQQGVVPWSVFDPMQTAAGRSWNQGIYDVAQERLGEEPALDVAMALTRERSLGADWESTGPGITSQRATFVEPVRPGDEREIRGEIGGRYGTASIVLEPQGDILSLAGAKPFEAAVGFVGVPARVTRGVGGDWCIAPGGCECPAGSPPRPPLEVGAAGAVGIALTTKGNGRARFTLTASTSSLEDWCAGEPLELGPSICDLLRPDEVAAALGDPRAAAGSQFQRINRDYGVCAYPRNDGNQSLTITAFTPRRPAAEFRRFDPDANGIRVERPAVGQQAVLVYHGATGNELAVLVNGGYLVFIADSIAPIPPNSSVDWVDEPLGAVLVELARVAATRIGS